MSTGTIRTIKKYANRRLYDLGINRYVTLGDLRKLVLSDIEFVVLEKHGATDVTDQVLLQILCANHDNRAIDRKSLIRAIRAQAGVM